MRPRQALKELARLYGIQTAYHGIRNRRHTASAEALLETLRVLGAPLDSLEDVPRALRERRLAKWKRVVEPVTLAWDGRPPPIGLRVPASASNGKVRCLLSLESGEVREPIFDLSTIAIADQLELEGETYVRKEIALPEKLPLGYHTLQCGDSWSTLILSAPTLAYAPIEGEAREWGIFLPLYSLHSQRSWGAGDFSDLESLLEWTAELGGRYVGTLPMSATFLEEPFEPSPYSPVSRLFWNEIFVDPRRTPELGGNAEARALVESSEIQRQIEAARNEPLVDYRRLVTLKRRALERLSRDFPNFTDHAALRRFKESKPVEDYAEFRAAQERHPEPWPEWPRPLRDGTLTPKDYDERAKHYHLFVQWTAEQQVQELERRAERSNVGLYLDLPLGVHPHGYDVWRHQKLFALGAQVGAPPDPVFTTGQKWGFPPLHPETIRESGYRYAIAYLRHQMRQARLLRIDHVMGLHRLFWIPKGIDARDGVYVAYRAEEQYALLSLESHRNQTGIVGENLGIVPAFVNQTMSRHGLYGMYVLQYSISPKTTPPVKKVPRHTVASLNTHDTPPFEGFLRGDDIQQQRAALAIDEEDFTEKALARVQAEEALKALARENSIESKAPVDILLGCLSFLASGPARLVLVNLEDLWRERSSQNVPGFPGLNPNWRRKARLALEDFSSSKEIRGILTAINSLRQQKRK
jgi:4-alpha-glucanotransferase